MMQRRQAVTGKRKLQLTDWMKSVNATTSLVVQVGANDHSLRYRNIDPAPKAVGRGWRALLIEPVPTLFEALHAKYASKLAADNSSSSSSSSISSSSSSHGGRLRLLNGAEVLREASEWSARVTRKYLPNDARSVVTTRTKTQRRRCARAPRPGGAERQSAIPHQPPRPPARRREKRHHTDPAIAAAHAARVRGPRGAAPPDPRAAQPQRNPRAACLLACTASTIPLLLRSVTVRAC